RPVARPEGRRRGRRRPPDRERRARAARGGPDRAGSARPHGLVRARQDHGSDRPAGPRPPREGARGAGQAAGPARGHGRGPGRRRRRGRTAGGGRGRGEGRPARRIGPMESSILWRRLDHPGHDACLLLRRDDRWHLAGNAAFVEGGRPCRLSYRVICDAEWRTLAARVEGSIGDESFEIALRVHPALRRWKCNGAERRAVAGCTDVDLSFTPATNLLPIRRLGLKIGEEAPVRAAWLRLPELTLEPLEQVYRRTGDRTYRYESRAGRPDDPF